MLNYANNNTSIVVAPSITPTSIATNHGHHSVNMKMSKLSNQTNSQDPQAVNSRIFVGNLNTFQCSKTDVERMFQIYGRLAGISMHKGYAFVQFTNPFDARNACLGEDGKMVLSQTLDVNMVAEPKAHQVGRKRQNVNKTGNDWDYFYDSYYSSTMNRSNTIRPKKRKRLMSNSSRMVSLSDAVNSSNINAAMAAATMAQQQQQLVQHQQQQQQQHHHHHQQQQQAAVVAMAAMANLLPQQQMLLHHQQSLLTNQNGTAGACNGTTTTPHHASLNMYLQQQQQHQQLKQQQAAAAAVAAAQYAAAATNGSLQLKMSSPLMTGPTGQAAASTSSLLTHDGDQLLATTTAPSNHQTQQQQMLQQTNSAAAAAHIMQPLTLTLSPQQQNQQQQQQHLQHHQQNHHHHHQQQQHHHQQQQQQKHQQLLQNQQALQQQIQDQLALNQQPWGPFKVYSNPDTLICGNCRECFNELAELLDHKRSYCKLRFTCKCQDITMPTKNPAIGAKLLCAVCKDAFTNPWDLMVHAQAAHMVNIYELGSEPNNNSSSTANNNNTVNSSGSSLNTEDVVGASEASPSSVLAINEPNINSNNNNGLHYNNDNDSNNNNTKNHNGIAISSSREANCFSLPGKMQQPTTQSLSLSSSAATASSASAATTMANVNGSDVALVGAVMSREASSNDNGCNGIVMSGGELGHSSDTEAHLELKFGICNSPIATINNKEETSHRDDGSLDGRMSDDIKMIHTNGSVSSRGSTPTMDHNEDMTQPRACIVRTLSIEASTTSGSPPTTSATLGLITNSLALSLNNSAATAAAALAPQ